MARAGIFIGVDQTGNLQRLHDAAAGAHRMHAWALAQGLADQTHARLITDEGGKKVDPDQVFDAIQDMLNGPGIEHLVLYFAGHGVNINRCEHWLMSDAPVKTSAAVNVRGSVELAAYCGIGCVTIISDACRVAPDGIQAQNVRGVDVFPNNAASSRAKPVDQFFACELGATAAEVKDAVGAATEYKALYTDAVLDALMGKRPELLERSSDPADPALYLKPAALIAYLEAEVPRRVKAMGLHHRINQQPESIVLVHPGWLARLDAANVAPASRGIEPPRAGSGRGIVVPAPSAAAVTQRIVQTAAAGSPAGVLRDMRLARGGASKLTDRLAGHAEHLAASFGPDHFESQCGIKVRGGQIVDFTVRRGRGELLTPELLRIDQVEGRAASVVVRFNGDVGTVIPAIPGFLAALTIDDGELVDVAYEPSANTWRWDLFTDRADDIRALRALAASASQHGRFRLTQADAKGVAQQMQYAKTVDPTLAVYAAHAYYELQEVDRIREMSAYLRDDLGVTIFDLELLGRRLIDKAITPDLGIVPFVPMLAQGWALLGAHKVRLPRSSMASNSRCASRSGRSSTLRVSTSFVRFSTQEDGDGQAARTDPRTVAAEQGLACAEGRMARCARRRARQERPVAAHR